MALRTSLLTELARTTLVWVVHPLPTAKQVVEAMEVTYNKSNTKKSNTNKSNTGKGNVK